MGCSNSKEVDPALTEKPIPVPNAARDQPQRVSNPVVTATPNPSAPGPTASTSRSTPTAVPAGPVASTKPAPASASAPAASTKPAPAPAPATPAAPAPTASTPAGQWPKTIAANSNLPFTVHVHHHYVPSSVLGRVPCWTYVSEGFDKLQRPEVVFTLRQRMREKKDNFPPFPIEWMRAVYDFATRGTLLEEGQGCQVTFGSVGGGGGGAAGNGTNSTISAVRISVNARMFFDSDPTAWTGNTSLTMFMLGVPIPDDPEIYPRGALPRRRQHVIGLKPEEAIVAQQFGVQRVLGHLGLSVRWFPYPPFVDRDRANVVTMADQSRSLRPGVRMARIYGVSSMVLGNEIIMSLPQGQAKKAALQACLNDTPLNMPLGLDCFITTEADSGLTWKSNQTSPQGYGANGTTMSKLNLAFLMFCPMQDRDNATMVEDGYTLLLKDSTWTQIRNAMLNSQDISVPLANNMRFRLEWIRTVYHNPMDGAAYEGDWTTYRAEGPQPRMMRAAEVENPPNVQLQSTILLNQPSVDKVSPKKVADFIAQVHDTLKEAIPEHPPAGVEEPCQTLIMEFQFPPSEEGLMVFAQPSEAGLDVQSAATAVLGIPVPEVGETIKFQLFFDLWGHQSQMDRFT